MRTSVFPYCLLVSAMVATPALARGALLGSGLDEARAPVTTEAPGSDEAAPVTVDRTDPSVETVGNPKR